MSLRRVLVCGSNYGMTYVRALAQAPHRYTLAGILARGSRRSRQAAERSYVPLFDDVDHVPDDVDLACAALGMNAHTPVLRLLERGIPVVCEHPLSAGLVRASLDAARASGTCFHVNGHWSGLDASRAFIDTIRQHRDRGESVHVHVATSDRLLYGALDIVGRALPGLLPVVLEPGIRHGPCVVLSGTLGLHRTTLRIESSLRGGGLRLEDGSPDYRLSYRILVESSVGTLSLLGTGGPVIWNANENGVDDVGAPLWTAVHDAPVSNRSLGQQRLDDNLRSVDALAAELYGGSPPPEQRPDYLLEISEAWDVVGALLAKAVTRRAKP